MRLGFKEIVFVSGFLACSTMPMVAETIKGTIVDKQTKEPLTGATVQVLGSTVGAVADLDGNYILDVPGGVYDLVVKYVGYTDIKAGAVKAKGKDVVLNFEMESDAQTLSEVSVVARKNLEGERALSMERQKATVAIENLGAKEMSVKGISNVQEGVKKITGISIASAGQLIVRGLGDVKQEDLHTLDFVATYKLNDHWNFKLQMTDLLNQDIVFKQEVKDGRKLEVERYGRGTTFELGFSYTL